MFSGIDNRKIVSVDPVDPVIDEEKQSSIGAETDKNADRMRLINELIMSNDRLSEMNKQLREQVDSLTKKLNHKDIVISEAVDLINELTEESTQLCQQSPIRVRILFNCDIFCCFSNYF